MNGRSAKLGQGESDVDGAPPERADAPPEQAGAPLGLAGAPQALPAQAGGVAARHGPEQLGTLCAADQLPAHRSPAASPPPSAPSAP